jgi:hypothetical protein
MKESTFIKQFFFVFFLASFFGFGLPQKVDKDPIQKPLIVFVTGDHEYGGEETLPLIAAELEKNYGFRTKVLKAYPDYNSEENIPGLEVLKGADVAVFFLRWRRLPADQVKHIEDYLKSGKPVVGFRTTTHAFNYPQGHELEKWNSFGELAFNAPPGWGGRANHTHYGHESSTDVRIIPEAAKNPILSELAKSSMQDHGYIKSCPIIQPKDQRCY